MIKIVYFSPTGNGKFLAKEFSKKLDNSKIYPMETTNYEVLAGAEHLILIYSIHGFNSPKTVNKFISDIPEGLCSNISIASVGCTDIWVNRGASGKVRNILQKKGYKIVSDDIIAMPLTLIMNFPSEYNKQLITNAKKKIEELSIRITSNELNNYKVPFKSKLLTSIGKIEGPAARLFGLELHANRECTSCGLCVKRCPQGNIFFNRKGKIKFRFNCIMCLRCIYECPVKAISPRISKFIPIKGGYKLSSVP